MDLLNLAADAIGAASGAPFTARERRPVSGGCINESWLVADGARRYFVKTNRAAAARAMFEAEAAGLAALAEAQALRVPRPIACGGGAAGAFLALEYLDLGGAVPGEALGRGLATLHRAAAARYGWERDNFIGATPQPNAWCEDWIEFLCEHRIGHQLELALQRGAGKRLRSRGEELLDRMPDLFRDYRPLPSLLHGDLWGGNAAATRAGEPVVFDPAVYYGDREADLAMTELFGGFGERFQAAYREAWPLDPGYGTRKTLYNLYHVLNHFNLFGGGYAARAEAMMERLLGELR